MSAAIKPISREYRIYLALWRKALHSKEEVQIKASNFGLAVAMRQGMYRAIRPFRNNEISDTELREAAEKFVLYLIKNEDEKGNHLRNKPHWIAIRARATLSELDAMMADLDINEDDLLVSDERGLSEKIKKLAKDLPPRDHVKTPFYTRDDD